MKTKIIVFIYAILMISCDRYDTRDLVVSNESTNTIYSILSKNDDMYGGGYYDELNMMSIMFIPKRIAFTDLSSQRLNQIQKFLIMIVLFIGIVILNLLLIKK